MSSPQIPTAVEKPPPDTDSRGTARGADLLAPRRRGRADWWYCSGHLHSATAEFAFHAAFFRFSSSGYRIGRCIPLRVFGTDLGFAHVSLLDIRSQVTYFAHRRQYAWRPEQHSGHLSLQINDLAWDIQTPKHRLSFDGRFSLQLDFVERKPIVSYGPRGLFESELPRRSYYVTCPRMEASGSVTTPDQKHSIEGEAWLDYESGEIGPDAMVAGWTWMSLQLDDDRELMVYQINRRDRDEVCTKAAIIETDGNVTVIPEKLIQLEPIATIHLGSIEGDYPVTWRVRLSHPQTRVRWELFVEPVLHDCQFDSRGTTSTAYWEGPVILKGYVNHEVVSGKGFLELVGFERRGGFGQMDHACKNLSLLGYLRNEWSYLWGGAADQTISRG